METYVLTAAGNTWSHCVTLYMFGLLCTQGRDVRRLAVLTHNILLGHPRPAAMLVSWARHIPWALGAVFGTHTRGDKGLRHNQYTSGGCCPVRCVTAGCDAVYSKLHVCDDASGNEISLMYPINCVCLAGANREGLVLVSFSWNYQRTTYSPHYDTTRGKVS